MLNQLISLLYNQTDQTIVEPGSPNRRRKEEDNANASHYQNGAVRNQLLNIGRGCVFVGLQ